MNVTENEMLESLKRSGYLLESEIAKKLSESNFFVRTGQVIEDPVTGKGREIDIIANSYGNDNHIPKWRTISQIEYVFEIKNNDFPIVLLTEFQDNPYIESWTGLKEAVNMPKNIKYDNFHEHYFEKLIMDGKKIFTQYCSFHKKRANDELMASHPDRFHESISKIIQYCDEQIDSIDSHLWNDPSEHTNEKYFRHFLYAPILLVNDRLYQLENDNLQQVESSVLVVNYYHQKEPRMAYIFIVTKKGISDFLALTQQMEKDASSAMANFMENNA